ncbi:MAG TPA: translation initiation factor IF-5A [Candidatus Bilamarchaeaceae archaeon]|nr:translation initiation factor IF-5A [Candidatus Bilamarchaeaceae archaeon]
MSEKVFASGKDLHEGKYVLIDDIPCRIASIDKSKTGKHGSAKLRIVAIGIFDGQKKNLLTSADADVEVPIIIRKNAQVMSVSGSTAQVMDQSNYEVFEMQIPPELEGQVQAGQEVELMEAMGRRVMVRIR